MNEIFGKRFKQLRIDTKLKQQDFVETFNKKYNFNFTRQAISLYENGKRIPEIDALTSFAEYFDVSVDYLLGRTDKRNTKSNNIEEENDIEKIIDELMEQQGLMLCGEPISKEDMILLRNSIRSTIELAKTMQNKK